MRGTRKGGACGVSAISLVAEVAGKRAAAFGRAPVIGDVELAMAVLGYDGSTDGAFAAWRARAGHGAAHHYAARRAVVDAVPDSLLVRPLTNLGEDRERATMQLAREVTQWRASVQ